MAKAKPTDITEVNVIDTTQTKGEDETMTSKTRQTEESQPENQADQTEQTEQVNGQEDMIEVEIQEKPISAHYTRKITGEIDPRYVTVEQLANSGVMDYAAGLMALGLPENRYEAYAQAAASEGFTVETEDGIKLIETADDWLFATMSHSERMGLRAEIALEKIDFSELDTIRSLIAQVIDTAKDGLEKAGLNVSDYVIDVSPHDGQLSVRYAGKTPQRTTRNSGENGGTLSEWMKTHAKWIGKYQGQKYFLTLAGTREDPKFLLSGGPFDDTETHSPAKAAVLVRVKAGVDSPNVNASQWWAGVTDSIEDAKEFWGDEYPK